MYCFYYTLENVEIKITDGTFIKRCERNSSSKKGPRNLDGNKMASVRRYVTREKKLTDEELYHIKTQVKNEMISSLYEETILETVIMKKENYLQQLPEKMMNHLITQL